ncbi:MAG: hypothetical protein K2W95_11705 [Candidatus Obscuribacterales bacterium]|nr:hypothetical protein [Candidatus Obscuribacterales bacterium]
MVYELARSLVQRIFQDKILMGLVIVLVLAIVVGGFGSGGSDRAPTGPKDAPAPAAEAGTAPAAKPPVGSNSVDPKLAGDFIKWWLAGAMDLNAATAQKSHSDAIAWMTADTVPAFQANFWPPELAEGITSGRITASFTPTQVQAVAVNPDGSVVVSVAGSLMMQQGPRPAVHQFVADFLVRKDQDGLRVAGVYNRTVASVSSSVY